MTATSGDLSDDGRWAAFSSTDSSLVRNDTNGVDEFLRSVRTLAPWSISTGCGHGVGPGPCDPH